MKHRIPDVCGDNRIDYSRNKMAGCQQVADGKSCRQKQSYRWFENVSFSLSKRVKLNYYIY
jgi:hypothetical protein